MSHEIPADTPECHSGARKNRGDRPGPRYGLEGCFLTSTPLSTRDTRRAAQSLHCASLWETFPRRVVTVNISARFRLACSYLFTHLFKDRAPPGKYSVSEDLLADLHASLYRTFSSITNKTDRWKVGSQASQCVQNQEFIVAEIRSTAIPMGNSQIIERDHERLHALPNAGISVKGHDGGGEAWFACAIGTANDQRESADSDKPSITCQTSPGIPVFGRSRKTAIPSRGRHLTPVAR